jgi:hypothetical protein
MNFQQHHRSLFARLLLVKSLFVKRSHTSPLSEQSNLKTVK